MAYETDLPPHKSAQPIAPPPDSDRPNAAMLKGDVDSGRTGDKVEVFDPGMAMLGTCEEAAGTPLTPEQIKTARDYETRQRWRLGGKKDAKGRNRSPWLSTALPPSSPSSAPSFLGCSGWLDG